MANSSSMLVALAMLPLLWFAARWGEPLLPAGPGDALGEDELERDPLYDEELWHGP